MKRQSHPNKGAVIIAAGGTGGHIFPALTLAHALYDKGHAVVFISDERGAPLIPPSTAYKHWRLPSASPLRKGFAKKAQAAFFLGISFFILLLKFLRHRPRLVFGFGGYPSFMPLFVARVLGIKRALHEQNSITGRVNRYFAPRVTHVYTAFKDPRGLAIPDNKHTWVGMPLRKDVTRLAQQAPLTPPYAEDIIKILVFGGTQGARVFTQNFPEALHLLPPRLRHRIALTQQISLASLDEVKSLYARLGLFSISLAPFFDDMPQKMFDAHLVISRAGASSLAELSTLGRPMLLVPLENTLDGDQQSNAAFLESNNAALVVKQKDFTPAFVSQILTELLENPKRLENFGIEARKLGKNNATQTIVEHLKACVLL